MKNVADDSRVKTAARELQKIQEKLADKKKELKAHNERTISGPQGWPVEESIFRFPEDKTKAKLLLSEIAELEKLAGQAAGAVSTAMEEVANEYRENIFKPRHNAAISKISKTGLDFRAALKEQAEIIIEAGAAGVTVSPFPLQNSGRGNLDNCLSMLEINLRNWSL